MRPHIRDFIIMSGLIYIVKYGGGGGVGVYQGETTHPNRPK